jgi:cell volume regulation protein A
MEATVYLTSIAFLLLFGILCSLISVKLKIPNILLLILVGIGLSQVTYQGETVIKFPSAFLTSIGILALVMIVFDSCSRFKLKQFDSLSTKALELTVVFLFLNLTFLTIATYFIFDIEAPALIMLFTALMSGTAPDAVLVILRERVSKVAEMLKIESIINTPLTVLLPFLILDFMQNIQAVPEYPEVIKLFSLQIVAGMGAGILVGIIVFKTMSKKYSEMLSPIAVITAALLTYILADYLGGNGVLAVTTLGLFFGNIYIKEKATLHEFSGMFANSLEILVFILIGLIISVPLSADFFVKSLLLFIIYLMIRYVSIFFVFPNSDYDRKEKLFMALNAPKGIAVAVIAFTLTTYNIPGLKGVLDLILVFMLYSIILSTAVTRMSKYFIRVDVK